MKRVLIGLAVLFLFFQTACQSQEELKKEKYFVEGYQLYTEHCANCHQTDGKGLEALYPPINGSDYLKNKEKVICLIRFGQNEPITVNGKRFSRPMPANPQLTDIDVAAITTYIYNKWGDETVISDVKEVSRVLDVCRDQQKP
ncbi:cytochrome c [Larkinella arboricola]|uniref:Cytochrome c n=1 Tax=Larkinella arboricola TaxID=643671 RepID=A0A327X2B7_LARAB|nr:cytochrome c [Larkinella arboricola]RAJ99808.1 cytochrome c [Larkinella arboricola]